MTQVSELGIIRRESEAPPARYAIALPGQGGTAVQAGLYDYINHSGAREVFDHADIVVGQELGGRSVSSLVFAGPQEELESTLNNHIANTTIYLAKYTGLREEHPQSPLPEVLMPISMGECAALAISGVVRPEEALKIAIKRGQATEKGGNEFPGCMASILDLKGGLPRLEELLASVRSDMEGVIDVSNIYTDKDLVISGQTALVEEALKRLVEGKMGVRKAYKLPISFASHCALMEKASGEFGEAIENIEFSDPQMPWIMNGELVKNGEEIKKRMVGGLTKRVDVRASLELMQQMGIPVMYEMSPKAEEKSIIERYAKGITPEMVVRAR